MNLSRRMLAGVAVAVTIGTGMSAGAVAGDYANPHLLVSPAALNELLARDDVRVIDVRPEKDYDAGHIPKALNIASHCQDGKASAHSYFTLRLLGFPRIRSYDRSWAEWGVADDLPKTVPQSRI